MSNFSSEAIDGVDYFGRRWPIWAEPHGPLSPNPAFFNADSCLGVQTAPTQELADLLAALAAQICALGGDPDGTFDDDPPIVIPPIDPPDSPIGPEEPGVPTTPSTVPPTIYYNTPQNCLWTCPDGITLSHVVDAGYFADTTQALADQRAYQYACQQVARNRMCFSSLNSSACLGELYDDVLVVNKGIGVITPVTFTVIAGAVPDGIVVSTSLPAFLGLSFYGTPTTAGNYSFTIQAVPVFGATITKTFTIGVLGITNADTLPTATEGTAYSELLTAAGGTGPYTWFVDPIEMPTWLSLATDGTLTGTPDAVDVGIDFQFSPTVTDSLGQECTQECTVSVVAGCIPDTGCNIPTAYSCVYPDSLVVSDYIAKRSEIIAPTADPSTIEPEWDGTLPQANIIIFPGTIDWFPAGVMPPTDVYAFNGILGRTIFIEYTPSHWVLGLYGYVGGVPTVIWQGIRSVGETPMGTYVRDTAGTPGIATGPDCFHVTGPDTPHALAWWRMEADATAVVDSSCGLVLSTTSITTTIVVGHVDNALRIHCDGTASLSSGCQNSTLSFPIEGITIVGWVQSVYNVSSPGNNNESVVYDFYIGGVFHQLLCQHFEGGNWICTLNGAGSINKAFAAGWHFLVITYDPATGTLGFDIDMAGMTTAAVAAYPAADVSALTHFGIGNGTVGLGDMDTDFDEFAIYNGVLTTAQLNCIYNAGAGRKW